jgi:hypothetical protein
MRRNFTYRLTGENYIIREEDGMMLNLDHPVFLNWLADGNKPLPVIEVLPTANENKRKAQQFLSDTDWVELPSVSDASQPKYLTNLNEFITYRGALRQIMLDLQDGVVAWPKQPTAVWS